MLRLLGGQSVRLERQCDSIQLYCYALSSLFLLRIADTVSLGSSPFSSDTVFLERSIAIHGHKQGIYHKCPNLLGHSIEVNDHL